MLNRADHKKRQVNADAKRPQGEGTTSGAGRLAWPGGRTVNLLANAAAGVGLIALIGFLLPSVGVPVTDLAWPMAALIVVAGAALLYLLSRVVALRSAAARQLDIIRGAYEGLRAPRVIFDAKGRAVFSNPAFAEMFALGDGFTIAALAGKLGGDSAARKQISRLRTAAAGGGNVQAEIQTKSKSGKIEWRTIEANPLKGNPGYVVLRIEDTTSRREMEQIIREEQDKLLDFLENAPVGFYSVDEEGRFIFVNHTLANWLGTTPEEILSRGTKLHDFVVTDDGKKAKGHPYDPFGGGGDTNANAEVTLKGRQGRVFQAHISQSVVESGEAGLRTRSVVRDLTPEREWEQALARSEQQFQRIFEDAPMGIALLDLDGVVTRCNDAFTVTTALNGGGVAGTEFAELIDEDDRDGVSARLAELVAGGEADAPLEIRIRGGSDTVLALYMNRIDDSEGRAAGIIVHGLDTTEQRNLEVQFAHSQKMQAVGQLAGGVAHDFNNLLTAMIGFCDLLLLRHKPGEQSFADAMQIKQNASRAANLVRQLLAFSRQQTLKPKVIDVTDILAELGHLLRRLVGENVELKTTHGRDLGLVRVDQGQLEQVIINLVVNARDAMPSGGEVRIRTSNVSADDPPPHGHEMLPSGDYVLTEVIDHGVGISKENIGRIFEPFFTTKEVGSGTGLGLSTVYGIVKQTGGFVFVDSELGKGTTFKIFLPRHQAKGETAVRAADEIDESSRDLTGVGTVVLVEDEDAVRLFAARALRNKGYTVLEAPSGEAAMEHFEENGDDVDLLITDVVMPNMDGPDLIRQVREMHPDIKVICISGYAEDAFRKRLDRAADIHFLPKPFSLNQLAGKVKDVMVAR